jgi:hypothetical protein
MGFAAREPLRAIAAEYGVSTTALHRHHHQCRSRAIVPVVASTADLAEVLPPPLPGQDLDFSAGIDRLFAEAATNRRSPAERRALAAYITDRAGIHADAVGDVRGALAVSRAMRAQAKQDEEATRQEESQPPAYVDKTLALLAAIMLDDPEEKRAALRDAGFPEDHLG